MRFARNQVNLHMIHLQSQVSFLAVLEKELRIHSAQLENALLMVVIQEKISACTILMSRKLWTISLAPQIPFHSAWWILGSDWMWMSLFAVLACIHT